MMRPIDMMRLKEMQRMVYAMAQGNFDVRISRSSEDDIIESIMAVLNMMGEEMRETLRLYSELHTREDVEERHLVFILDYNFQIQFVSLDVLAVLGYESKDLLKKSFSSLLAHNQLGLWRKIGSKVVDGEPYREQHRIIIRDKNGQERYCNCIINPIYSVGDSRQLFMIGISETSIRSVMIEDVAPRIGAKDSGKRQPPNVLLRPKDRKILRSIHDNIVKDVEKPLPSLVKLAHLYGINEFKLKYGFKQLYGTSVFRFQKQERLRKGKLLIENTSLPIKSVMVMCGYVNHSHFSKDFRMAFGISPREVRGEG